jgi:hypothetical protein
VDAPITVELWKDIAWGPDVKMATVCTGFPNHYGKTPYTVPPEWTEQDSGNYYLVVKSGATKGTSKPFKVLVAEGTHFYCLANFVR